MRLAFSDAQLQKECTRIAKAGTLDLSAMKNVHFDPGAVQVE